MSKSKGTRYERELFHMFYGAGHMVLRIAGSGSTPIPSCDLVVNCNKKHLAIECKYLKGDKKYMDDEELAQLKNFAEKFNAAPILAIRFDREEWYFLDVTDLNKLERTKNNFVISSDFAKNNGMTFEKLINWSSYQ